MNHKKIFFAEIFLVVFGLLSVFNLPRIKAAMTAAEMQALIQQLQQQINQLQQRLSSQFQTTSVSWCHNFNVDLQIGNYSSEVLALKTALQKEGFLTQTDNNFDEKTASAVVGLQEKYRASVLSPLGLARGTGFVGNATRTKLNSLYGCGTSSVSAPVSASPSVTVVYPNGGEILTAGQTYTITWRATGASRVKIEECGETPRLAVKYTCEELSGFATIDAGLGYRQWWVDPNDPFYPGRIKIRVSDVSNPSVYDESDNYVTIFDPTEPNWTEFYSSQSAPSQVTNLSAVNNAGYALLSWDAPYDGGSSIQNYRIYQGTSSGNVSFIATTQFTNYTDSGVTRGVTYYYRVKAVNASGESDFSNQASVLIPSSSSSQSSNEYVKITNVSPLSVTQGQTFSVSWQASSHFQGCRVWFEGSNETKPNLSTNDNFSFSTTSGVSAGSYRVSVRCFRPSEMGSMSNYNNSDYMTNSAYNYVGAVANSTVNIKAINQTSTTGTSWYSCDCEDGVAIGEIAKCSNVIDREVFCSVQCRQQVKGSSKSNFTCID